MDMNSSEFWQTELGKLYLKKLKNIKDREELSQDLVSLWSNFSESATGIVQRSNRPEKKFKVLLRNGRTIHFGARGYVIGARQDSERGEDFCSRSYGQRPRSSEFTPWFGSQMTWACNRGKLSGSAPVLKLGDNIYDDKFSGYFERYGVKRE